MLVPLVLGLILTSPQDMPTRAPQTAKEPASVGVPTSATKHSITLPSRKVDYTATAAQLPLRNAEGDVECRMFYVAYTDDHANAKTRPVTFAFNGGPGSATLWLHMGGLGPVRAPMPDDGSLPQPPYSATANMDCWLDFTDIVFVDAPATGFSRLARADLGRKYFGVRQDIAAFTEFVRGWLVEHKRWSSPLFIAGESYGGIRGSGLSNSLFHSGIAVNGFISISGSNNFLTLDGMRGNDATYIGFLPSMAACAYYHHKLAAKYKSVEQVVAESTAWVDKEYGPALLRGNSLSVAEKDAVASRLSQFLGISKQYCLGSNLRVSEFAFFKELLREEGLSIGRYDGRLVAKEELTVGRQQANDPSDDAVTAPFYSSFNGYVTEELKVKTDLKYMIFGDIGNWQSPEGSYPETSSDLREVLMANRFFRVLFACGYYDLACPFNASIYTVNHMGLDAESRSRVKFSYYPAGHMMYIEKVSRKKFHDDVKQFVADTLPKG